MLISQRSKETIDACRFCWMCRHLCPIGMATGQERNTARARALTLSLVERGAAELSDVIDNVYECALCGGCTNNCMTGWDPVKFTKEVRLEAINTGVAPEYILKLLDNIEAAGNAYGITELPGEIAELADACAEKTDTLLYLGTDVKYKNPAFAVDAAAVLRAAGVKFTVLADEPDSGAALDFLAGEAGETVDAAKKCAAALANFKKVIVLDPADAKMMKHEYKEWDIAPECEIVTFTAFAASLIEDGTLSVKKLPVPAAYQDAFALVRDLDECEEPRIIMNACTNLTEMLLNRKEMIWGGNTLMAEYIPDVIKLVSKNRWADAAHMNAKLLVVASPSEYVALANVKPDDMEIMSLPELILATL
ncbi:MAG: (Fe-S)-binding protein [Ruminococcaceae bacterium]|nr:(Fe-S)-binding protein [Oscillospiraceae bacterium]